MRVFITGTTGFSGSARPGPGLCQQARFRMVGGKTPAMTQLAMTRRYVHQARCEALFVSDLQPTDAPTADMVAEAIERTVRQFGVRGCAARMAQEFGDHPDAAATRMRWVHHLAWAAARPQASPGAQPPGRAPGRCFPMASLSSLTAWRADYPQVARCLMRRARAVPPCRTDAPSSRLLVAPVDHPGRGPACDRPRPGHRPGCPTGATAALSHDRGSQVLMQRPAHARDLQHRWRPAAGLRRLITLADR
jgi:hypothetical protein